MNLCVQSILTQSLTNFELLLVIPEDDPETLHEAERLRTSDTRIRILITPANFGLSEALNFGVKHSKAPLIARMDSDDWSTPNRLESQYNYLQRNSEIGIVGTNIKTFGSIREEWRMPNHHNYIQAGMLFRSTLLHPTVMFRKSLFTNDNLRYIASAKNIPEDLDLWIRASRVTKTANLNNFCVLYRIHNSEAGKKKEIMWKNLQLLVIMQLQELGLEFTKREIDLHMSCVHNISLTKQLELNELENWFLKIRLQNEINPIFNEKALKDTLMHELLIQYKNVHPVPPSIDNIDPKGKYYVGLLRKTLISILLRTLSAKQISTLRDFNKKMHLREMCHKYFHSRIILRKIRTYGFFHVYREFTDQVIVRLRLFVLKNFPTPIINLIRKARIILRKIRTYGFFHVYREFTEQVIVRIRLFVLKNFPTPIINLIRKAKNGF